MNTPFHILNATGDLDPFISEIENTFSAAVEKVSVKIPVSNIDVVIANNPQGAIPEIGIGGRTLNAHLIFISVNSNFVYLKHSISENLEKSLAHELHHCARWSTVGYGRTLLEAMITEGLADHFAIEVTGKEPSPWCIALAQNQIEPYVKEAEKEYHNEKYNHDMWFFGKGNADIPRWTGYSLGFYLVKDYLKKHPNKKPSQLYSVKAIEFI